MRGVGPWAARALNSPLARGAALSGLLLFGGKGLLFLMHIALGRALDPAGYGVFSVALNIANVLALAAACGFQVTTMRRASEHLEARAWGELKGHLVLSGGVAIAGGAALSLVAALVALLAPAGEFTAALALAAFFVLPTAFAAWRLAAMRGLHSMVGALAPREWLTPILVMAGVWGFGVASPGAAAFVYVAAFTLVEGAVGLAWLMRVLPEAAKRARARILAREDLRAAAPMGASNLTQYGVDVWDVVFVGALLGAGPAGLYAAAARIAQLGALPGRVVYTTFAPHFAAARAGGRAAVERLMARAVKTAALLGLAAFAVLMLGAELLIALFGEGYGDAATVLRVLALGQFALTLGEPWSTALQMAGHERAHLKIMVASAGLNLAALTPAILIFGPLGAAAVTAATMGLRALAFWRVARSSVL